MKRIVFLLLVAALPVFCSGQSRADRLTPRWMHSTVSSHSQGVRYVAVTVVNPSGQGIGAQALDQLARTVQNDWTITQTIKTSQTDILQKENGQLSGSERRQVSVLDIVADGQPVAVNCMLADEWWSQKPGDRRYCALYQLALNSGAVFDNVYPTNDYGATPLFMSIIPGVGQFYKGDVLKGSLFLGGCAATGAGVVFLESQRKACRNQLSQTHDINRIRSLSADEQNYAIARNVTIGVTAALYLYNLIDAAIAPGARRVRVTSGGVNYSF